MLILESVKDQLSPILSALYMAPVLHILEKHLKILKILVSILSFVDDGLLVAQSKLLTFLNNFLFCSYHITSSLLKRFSLIMEHGKTEVFYFSRLHGIFDPPPLNLITLEGPILCSKNTWRYLDFIFDGKLSFQQHIDFYTNKVISTVKYMKILGNSVVLFSIRSNFYIEVASPLLSFTVFNYSSTTKYHYPILSKN